MMEKDVTFIIFGATGDLTRLKLIPAIYKLIADRRVERFAIIGLSRSEVNIIGILDEAKKNVKDIDENVWKKIVDNTHHLRFDASKEEDYSRLKEFVEEVERRDKLGGNRLMYLATLPEHFKSITRYLASSQIVKDSRGYAKVLYEKPFGNDLKSAKEINDSIHEVFDEKNVYRVDHYLGKELVGNIVLLRFTNRILEPLWNNGHIDSVQIILDEDFGVKNRGKFYDKYGAVKDILQNHALQIISLIAMESPKKLYGDHIRDKKLEVLQKTELKDIILGQYEGYKDEEHVDKKSKTETFFQARIEIDNERWRGVPFFVRAGKNLEKKQSLVVIKFKDVENELAQESRYSANYLTIRIQPDEGYTFELNSKQIGKDFEVETAEMDFCHECIHGPNTPESYEVLLEEAIKGEQSLFVRDDVIEAQWRIADSIERGEVFVYEIGSNGPKEARHWEEKHGVKWKH